MKRRKPWRTGMSVEKAAAIRRKRQNAALQRKFNRLAGPVTVRKIGDPKPDNPTPAEQEQE